MNSCLYDRDIFSRGWEGGIEFSLRDKRGNAHAAIRITYIINIGYKSSSYIL